MFTFQSGFNIKLNHDAKNDVKISFLVMKEARIYLLANGASVAC